MEKTFNDDQILIKRTVTNIIIFFGNGRPKMGLQYFFVKILPIFLLVPLLNRVKLLFFKALSYFQQIFNIFAKAISYMYITYSFKWRLNVNNLPIDMYEPVFSIGIIAQKLGIAVQTVRLYEKEGLILPFKSPTGRRFYSLHDWERLKCLRQMITEYGINLQGIKRIMAFIPCWEFRGGLDDNCLECPAYFEATGPCWSLSKVGEKCQKENCRTCPVYKINLPCSKMKEVIYGHKR